LSRALSHWGEAMKPFAVRGRSRGTKAFGIIVVASLLSGLSVPATAPAQPKEPSTTQPPQAATTEHATAAEREEWRKSLLATPGRRTDVSQLLIRKGHGAR
jgi:hypothetical protein